MTAVQIIRNRAERVRDELETTALDGSIVVFTGVGASDMLLDGGALRDCEAVIADWSASRQMPTLVYSVAQGVRAKNAPNGPRARVPSGIDVGTPPSIALDVIVESMRRGETATTLVLQFAEGWIPDEQASGYREDAARIIEQLAARATDPVWTDLGHRIVLVARTEPLDGRLIRLPGFSVVELGLPEAPERETALELMQHSQRHAVTLPATLPLAQAARVSGGLTLDDLSRLRFRSSAQRPLDIGQILERKRQAIRRLAGDSLVVVDDPPNLERDVAGLPQVRRLVGEAIAAGNYSLRAILNGPPGNGKTWVAKSIAGALGVPAIVMGRIEARYVGESQDNLRRAFDAIRANLPACLIVDEIDQTVMARRGGQEFEGSPVKSDLRSMFFEFLGDVGDQGGLSVIGMSNRPDLLDEASNDRFAKIPVLHPEAPEAALIMAIQARRAGLDLDVAATELVLSETQRSFSGRQLVRLLDSAHVHAVAGSAIRISGEDVRWAISDAMESIGAGEVRMALLAVAATSFNRHLPWNAAKYLGNADARPPQYLEPFVLGDGTVDLVALKDGIRELDRHGL